MPKKTDAAKLLATIRIEAESIFLALPPTKRKSQETALSRLNNAANTLAYPKGKEETATTLKKETDT